MGYAIEIKNLSVYYNSICALSNINLTVDEGGFLAVIGPNGGGKSTLLKTVLGYVRPQEGQVVVFGKKPEGFDMPVGYVPQSYSFDRQFPIRVLDVVLTGRLGKSSFKPFFRYGKKDLELALNLLEVLGIGRLKDRQMGQLSGGQIQKVLIARALAVEPRILLLDEPTANVDGESKSQIFKFLKEINSRVTVVLVTHDIELVYPYVKSVAYLNRELYYCGKPELKDIAVQPFKPCGEPDPGGPSSPTFENHGW